MENLLCVLPNGLNNIFCNYFIVFNFVHWCRLLFSYWNSNHMEVFCFGTYYSMLSKRGVVVHVYLLLVNKITFFSYQRFLLFLYLIYLNFMHNFKNYTCSINWCMCSSVLQWFNFVLWCFIFVANPIIAK